MRNILIITKREFLTQVKKKYFIIVTLLAPLLVVLFGFIIGMLFKANQTHHHIQVIDHSGFFKSDLKNTNLVSYSFPNPTAGKKLIASLKNEDQQEEIGGILVIPTLENNDFEALEKNIRFLTNKKTNFETKQSIVSGITDVVRKQKVIQMGITEAQLKDLDKNFELNTINVLDEKDKESDLTFGIKSGLSFLMMYVVFMFIIIYGVRIMRSVLEEKNNRIVEIIISSVKPYELMIGKIFGVTLVGLTQFIAWIGMTVGFTLIFSASQIPSTQKISGGQLDNMAVMLSEVSNTLLGLNFVLIIFCFILYFILGYIFYSAIYAAIGSAVDNETETQQFTLFAILPLSLGLYGSIGIIQNPEGPMAFWLSMIPLTSPVAMVARIPFGVPIWEIALSLFLLALSTVLMIFVAAKIYRIGILMYGNKATLKEIWKWLRS